MTSARSTAISVALSISVLALAVAPAQAGCGCDKPPPPPAQVRPNVAYAGAPVSFFSPVLSVGSPYTVTFANAISGATASVQGQVVSRRDLADGVYKPQLIVPLPRVPIGPTNIVVTGPSANSSEVLFIPESSFTVAPDPIAVPGQPGTYGFTNVQAAVSDSGVLYVALDLTNVTDPLVVEAQTVGLPMRFGTADVVFWDIQGFLMQQLVQSASGSNGVQPLPGMWVIPASSTDAPSNSDLLHYSRHEFETYFIQHQERQPHAVDPSDPNWHMDGSRHVDHNHLLLAIKGRRNDGTALPPGATSPFTLRLRSYSLFYQGIVGLNSVSASSTALIDSYDPATMGAGANGDVLTDGKLSLSGQATIKGNTTAQSYNVSGSCSIAGTRTLLTSPVTFMQIKLPTLLTNLGTVNLGNSVIQSLKGPGTFLLSSLTINGGKLVVDNSAGPVTFYVTGGVSMNNGGTIQVADPNPEKFAIYVTGSAPVSLDGKGNRFYGVVYAPTSTVSITGSGQFSGAFVGSDVQLSNAAQVHYDSALK